MSEKISIVIPVYNAEKTIEKCLDSIMLQSFENFECICIDDGSFDASYQRIMEYINKDKRFRYFYQENSGPSSARNRGIMNSTGTYIVFVDSDDYIAYDYLEKLYNKILREKADICFCGYTVIGDRLYKQHDYLLEMSDKNDYLEGLFKGTGGTICSKIFRSSIIRDNSIYFNLNYRLCEDQIFILEFMCKAEKFARVDYYGYYYVDNKESLSKNPSYDILFHQIEILNDMERILVSNDTQKDLIEKCIELKARDVILSLTKSCVIQGKESFNSLLSNPNVQKILKRIKIDDKYSILYILPVKVKSWRISKIIYGRLIRKFS